MPEKKVVQYALAHIGDHVHYFVDDTAYICRTAFDDPPVSGADVEYEEIYGVSLAAKYDEITKIVVHEGVEAIYYRECFNYLSAREVVLPKSTTRIAHGAFLRCPIEKMVIPKTVKYLGAGSLMDAKEVTYDVMNPGVLWYAISYSDIFTPYNTPQTKEPLIWHTVGGATVHLPRMFEGAVFRDIDNFQVELQFRSISDSWSDWWEDGPMSLSTPYKDLQSFDAFFELLEKSMSGKHGYTDADIFPVVAALAVEVDAPFPSMLTHTEFVGRMIMLGIRVSMYPSSGKFNLDALIMRPDSLSSGARLDELMVLANSRLAEEFVWSNQERCEELLEEANAREIPQFAAVVLDKGHKYGGLNTDATDFEL